MCLNLAWLRCLVMTHLWYVLDTIAVRIWRGTVVVCIWHDMVEVFGHDTVRVFGRDTVSVFWHDTVETVAVFGHMTVMTPLTRLRCLGMTWL